MKGTAVVVLAKPTSWVAGGEERTWGLRPGRSVTKRAIPFRARQKTGRTLDVDRRHFSIKVYLYRKSANCVVNGVGLGSVLIVAIGAW